VKLLDANVILYAYNRDAAHHTACRDWLEAAVNADEPVGLPWQTSLAFIRISTNPKATRTPLSGSEACEILSSLLVRPSVVTVEAGERFWEILVHLIRAARVAGPLVTDAALAALAIEQGAVLCSTDRDFRRFDGLRLLDPTQVA